MEDHKYDTLELNENFEIVKTRQNCFYINYCVMKLDQCEIIMNKKSRSSPEPNKISFNILKKYLNAAKQISVS